VRAAKEKSGATLGVALKFAVANGGSLHTRQQRSKFARKIHKLLIFLDITA
jgi:hypothetical protein